MDIKADFRTQWPAIAYGNSTQIGAKIAVLRGTAYPELGLISVNYDHLLF
jgi:hypothetical protein